MPDKLPSVRASASVQVTLEIDAGSVWGERLPPGPGPSAGQGGHRENPARYAAGTQDVQRPSPEHRPRKDDHHAGGKIMKIFAWTIWCSAMVTLGTAIGLVL